MEPAEASSYCRHNSYVRANIYSDDLANANAKAGEIIKENLAPKAELDELACPSEK